MPVSIEIRLALTSPVNWLLLRPASLTHYNPQRRKMIHGMAKTGRSIRRCVFVEYPVRVTSVAVMAVILRHNKG